jgi:molecular chaperone DnaJ
VTRTDPHGAVHRALFYVDALPQVGELAVVDGDDLHCTISVPMVDAALGTTVTVDAIIDGPTELTIPAGTQPGSVTTLRGHGMPHLRSGVRGDLHAHIEVMVPQRLDHEDIELLHKLKEKRIRDVAEVRSTQSASTGSGFFSRLRETFTGR